MTFCTSRECAVSEQTDIERCRSMQTAVHANSCKDNGRTSWEFSRRTNNGIKKPRHEKPRPEKPRHEKTRHKKPTLQWSCEQMERCSAQRPHFLGIFTANKPRHKKPGHGKPRHKNTTLHKKPRYSVRASTWNAVSMQTAARTAVALLGIFTVYKPLHKNHGIRTRRKQRQKNHGIQKPQHKNHKTRRKKTRHKNTA